MWDIFRRFFIAVLVGFFTDASAQQPPPEVMVDKYLVQAEQLFEKQDYIAALNRVEKILALQKEHNITLPHEFHFKYAQIAFSTGSTHVAFDAVSKYLSAEQEGEFYEEALVLLIKIEKVLAKFKVFGGSQLTNHPACYFWNFSPEIYPPMTWSGACSDGFAQGKGTLIGDSLDDMYFAQGLHSVKKVTRKETGQFQNGKKHGHWVESYKDSTEFDASWRIWLRVSEGLYVEGKRQGYWVTHLDSLIMEAGPYMDGKRHGDWVHYFSDENLEDEGPYTHISSSKPWYSWYGYWDLPRDEDNHRIALSEGPYVKGKRHGRWVVRLDCVVEGYLKDPFNNWIIIKQEGPYVKGRRHGDWVYYFPDGSVEAKGSYVNNKRHGDWVHYFPDGSVRIKASWANGKKHGDWVHYFSDGSVRIKASWPNGNKYEKWVTTDGSYVSFTSYVNGNKHSYRMRQNKSDTYQQTDERLYLDGEESDSWGFVTRPGSSVSVEVEGPDENGKVHLTYRNSDGDEWGGSYVNGKRHGHWIERPWSMSDGKNRLREGSYVEGKRHGKWIFRYPNGDIEKLEFRNGEEQYPKLWYDYDEEKCWSVYDHKKKKKVKKEICLE